MSTIKLEYVDDAMLRLNFERIEMALNELLSADFVGTGDPNTVITASPPAIYRNRAGGAGTTLWVKESGVQTNTGWVGL